MGNIHDKVGLVFPIIIGPNGDVPLATLQESIVGSIQTILSWPKFTRWFSMSFGSRVFDLLEEPNDEILAGLASFYVKEAISSYEDRVTVLDATVTRTSPETLEVNIRYEITSVGITDTTNLTLNLL